MNKKFLLILFGMMLLTALMATPKQSDLEIRELHGPVESMSIDSYKHYFDEQGKIILETYDYDFDLFGEINYVYDEESRLLSIENVEGESGELVSGTYNTYDKEGRLREMANKGMGNDKITKYTYDNKGNLTWTKIFDEDDNLVSAEEQITDKRGNPIRKNFYDNDMNLKIYMLFEYNKSGYETKMQTYIAGEKLFCKITYKYNNLNQVTKRVDCGPDGATDRNLRSFDEKGNLTEERSINIQNGKTSITSYVYVYDERGNWTEKTIYIDGKEDDYTYRTISYYPLDK